MSKKLMPTLVAVDVAKEKLDYYIVATEEHGTLVNETRAIGSWLSTLKKTLHIEKIVLEPTGGYEDKLLRQLHKNKQSGFFIQPNRFHAFKKERGEKAKTDRIDAFYLAEYALAHAKRLTSVEEAHFDTKKMKELIRSRRQIQETLQRYKNYSEHGFQSKSVKSANKKIIQTLTKELDKIKKAIDEAIDVDNEKKQNRKLLKSIKGVGPVVSSMMVTCVPELGLIDNNRLASLIGVAPFSKDSGKYKGKRTIRGGRMEVRCALYMAALSAVRHSPRIKTVYERLIANGKLKKIALVAIMRRLLRIMNAVIREQKPYDQHNGLAAQIA